MTKNKTILDEFRNQKHLKKNKVQENICIKLEKLQLYYKFLKKIINFNSILKECK